MNANTIDRVPWCAAIYDTFFLSDAESSLLRDGEKIIKNAITSFYSRDSRNHILFYRIECISNANPKKGSGHSQMQLCNSLVDIKQRVLHIVRHYDKITADKVLIPIVFLFFLFLFLLVPRATGNTYRNTLTGNQYHNQQRDRRQSEIIHRSSH